MALAAPMPFADALHIFNTAPRLEPMTREVQDAMVAGLYSWQQAIGTDLHKYERHLYYLIGGEAASAVRAPQLCAFLPDKLLDAMHDAMNNVVRRREPNKTNVEDLPMWHMIHRCERAVARERAIRSSDPLHLDMGRPRTRIYPNGVMPAETRLELAGMYDQAEAKHAANCWWDRQLDQQLNGPYVYTDARTGMQRRHDPTNIAHLRREVGLPVANVPVSSLRTMAFNAIAADAAAPPLPAQLAPEFEARRRLYAQMTQEQSMGEAHASHARLADAAIHKRNALAYEKQLMTM